MNSNMSRFILVNDEKLDEVIMKLPSNWWSRPYEYAWAVQFVENTDTVLDAACGVCHPFKYYLLDRCEAVYGCDLDERVLSKEAVLAEVAEIFESEAIRFPLPLLNQVNLSIEDITNTSYSDKMFDKIFCISVIEHLKEEDIIKTFLEFKRILKNKGKLVLTIDVPYFPIERLPQIVDQTGWEFVGEVDLKLPVNALSTDLFPEFPNGLYSFRALLQKKE